MSNQESSPPGPVSPGTTGPVEMAFEEFFRRFVEKQMSPEAKHNLKLTWYLSAMYVYNTLMTSFRGQPALVALMTSAMRTDLVTYFDNNPMPVGPGELTPPAGGTH